MVPFATAKMVIDALVADVPTTVDALLHGRLVLEQPAHGHGYRFNADSVYLARFGARVAPSVQTLADLGAGVGTVALAYHCLAKAQRIVLVERQRAMCAIAARNLARSRAIAHDQTLSCDVDLVLVMTPGLQADLVLSNPPYTQPSMGRRAYQGVVDGARHGDVLPFLRTGAKLLRGDDASFAVCYPAHDIVRLLRLARDVGLHAVRLQLVHATRPRAARLALVAFRRKATYPGTTFDPPMIEDDANDDDR
ncbi:MAG: methyltransferase [Polyangiaceae bacterium]|jgi:tRNA1(Val) A37 N6-methylase TrmN6|nr:methyltransferase [Polyangiaceae bacterium]